MPDKQLQLGENEDFQALTEAWDATLDVLEKHVNKPSYESWIKTAKPLSIDDNVVRIGTFSQFAKSWLETKHAGMIKDVLENHLGNKIKLKIELVKNEEPTMMTEKLPTRPAKKKKEDDEPISQPLNPKFTFDSFVVGPTNRLAQACAESVACNPGHTYNPLFIYGGAGLGKTHLMHAIGQIIKHDNPKQRVVYVSGETFTYHYITALREHRTQEFRKKYRSVDIWLFDDIQFLIGKDRTEEEFFHTFNAIHDMNKQIVLTSDRAPKELELDGRLLSRFESGMLADIMPPDLETRMAILQSKADSERMALSNDVILYIAKLIRSNIRQLEGALIKLHAYASLMRTSVTTTLAEEVLGQYFTAEPVSVVDIAGIQDAVAEKYRVDVGELVSSGRRKDIVVPRQLAMYLSRELTESSLPSIGKAFGGRDHTTVLHACKKTEEKIARDKDFQAIVDELSRKICGGKNC